MPMQKVSSRDAAALLKQAGAAIRSLVKEKSQLQVKLAAQIRDQRVVKIAREMEEKGLSSEYNLAEKVAHLRKAPNLDVTEQAVKLAAPQGRAFGVVSEVPGNGQHAFESFILTGETENE
jgi:uncharacterized protein YacL